MKILSFCQATQTSDIEASGPQIEIYILMKYLTVSATIGYNAFMVGLLKREYVQRQKLWCTNGIVI